MMDNRRKLFLIICLFSSIPLLFGCFLDAKRILEIAADNQELLPIRRLAITIDPSQREELFSQFQRFAEKHGFEIEFSDYGSSGEIFQIWMLRDNIKIIANDIPGTRNGVTVKFYDQSRSDPVPEKTLETIDDLRSDLESFISEIPNVTITEK